MLDLIKCAIDNYYVCNNYQLFKERCNLSLNLPEELALYVKHNNIKLIQGGVLKDDPSREFYIHFKKYKKNEFEIEYTTRLIISRVTPVFNIQHEFDVEHKNIDRIDPKLGYYNDNPYTKQQTELHNEIAKVLTQKGYIELKHADMNEVVEGFKIPKDVTIFGKDITVETLLFRDVLDLCGRTTRQKQGAK